MSRIIVRICTDKGKNFTNHGTDGSVASGGALDPNDHRRRRRHDARACDKAAHTRQPVCIKPGPVHPGVQCKLPPTPPSPAFDSPHLHPLPPPPTDSPLHACEVCLCESGRGRTPSLWTRSSVPLTQLSAPLARLSVPLTRAFSTLNTIIRPSTLLSVPTKPGITCS